MKVKVVSEDVGAQKMVPKHKLFKNIPLHIQKLNYRKNIYELEEHVGEEAYELELVAKTWACKKNSFCKFFQSFTRKHLSQIYFLQWMNFNGKTFINFQN
jgi:hypothetical protein